MFVAVMTNEC